MSITGTGAQSSISIANNAALQFKASDTIEMWFKTGIEDETQVICSKEQSSPSAIGWDFRIRSHNNKLRYYAWNGAQLLGNFYTSGTVTDGKWHYAVCRIQGTTMYGYLDGVYQGQASNGSWVSATNTGPMTIGGGFWGDIGGIIITDTYDIGYIHSRSMNGKLFPVPDENTRCVIQMNENTGTTINEILAGLTGSMGANWGWQTDPGYARY